MPWCTSAINQATMSELICSGCQTLLLYNPGAANIRCSRCNRVNSTRTASQIAHLTCGQCRTMLMYQAGATTVECATCQHINPGRGQGSSAPPDARPQTVLVENPRTMNDKGKLVSNMAVGVTSRKR